MQNATEYEVVAQPTEKQLSFVRRAAQGAFYLGLGNTNCNRPEIEAFALSSPMAAVLSNTGKEFYYFNRKVALQPVLDEIPGLLAEDAATKLEGTGFFSGLGKSSLCEQFTRSVQQNPGINFRASDSRDYDAIAKQLGYKNSRDMLFYMINGTAKESRDICNAMNDDCAVARMIQSTGKPSVLLCESSRFTLELEDRPHSYGIWSLLPQDRKHLYVINIYPDDESCDTDLARVGIRKPEAALVIAPGSRNDGLRVLTPTFN